MYAFERNKKMKRLVVTWLVTALSIVSISANDDDLLMRVIDSKINSNQSEVGSAYPDQFAPNQIKFTEIKKVQKQVRPGRVLVSEIRKTKRNKADGLDGIIQRISEDAGKNTKSNREVAILTVDRDGSNYNTGFNNYGNSGSDYQFNDYLNGSLLSKSAMVVNARTGKVMYQKNPYNQVSLASISKLMAAMVLLDAKQDMSTYITITDEDVDRLKSSGSRLMVGTTLTRQELLHIGLMSSENRAIHALARNYPGGMSAFVSAMNAKARQIGMQNSVFYEPTGLNPRNKSTAADIVKMAQAADGYPLIRYYTTAQETQVRIANGKILTYKNSNALVRNGQWDVSLQKTGYIREAGRCMVVKSRLQGDEVYLVFLGAPTSYARVSDAEQVKQVFSGGRYY